MFCYLPLYIYITKKHGFLTIDSKVNMDYSMFNKYNLYNHITVSKNQIKFENSYLFIRYLQNVFFLRNLQLKRLKTHANFFYCTITSWTICSQVLKLIKSFDYPYIWCNPLIFPSYKISLNDLDNFYRQQKNLLIISRHQLSQLVYKKFLTLKIFFWQYFFLLIFSLRTVFLCFSLFNKVQRKTS